MGVRVIQQNDARAVPIRARTARAARCRLSLVASISLFLVVTLGVTDQASAPAVANVVRAARALFICSRAGELWR